MPVRTRRWNDPPLPDDGLRILITRYRPRGVAKADETWHVWRPELGPSRALLAQFKGKGTGSIDWPMYRRLYLREMKHQLAAIRELADRVRRGETITLLCSSSCDRESRCHRSILKELIEQQL